MEFVSYLHSTRLFINRGEVLFLENLDENVASGLILSVIKTQKENIIDRNYQEDKDRKKNKLIRTAFYFFFNDLQNNREQI